MPQREPLVRWAPRVAPAKIRRLYQTDALGIYDEELIDEVGFGLYARCQSLLTVTEAAAGRVGCPRCGAILLREMRDAPDEMLRCACGWETSWARYHRMWRHQELYGGGAVDAFAAFVRDWPRTATPQRKMLLIDELIHRWHWQTRDDHALGRPVGVNLIEGSRAQVLALLDALTSGSEAGTPAQTDPHAHESPAVEGVPPASSSALEFSCEDARRETHAAWRETRRRVREAQRERAR